MHDYLNDPLTHVERCGSIIRSPVNERLTPLAQCLPASFQGVPVEYDLTYESPADTITGYRYTDLLTTCIALFPCNTNLNTRILSEIVSRPPTAVGREVADKVQEQLQDKYKLRKPSSNIKCDTIVILPGSNILQDNVNWDVVDKALRRTNSWIKPHPITVKLDVGMLRKRYPGQVLEPQTPLYPLLSGCSKAYFPANSETGFAVSLLGKDATLISGGKWNGIATFVSYYRAIDECRVNRSVRDKIATLFSYPESGLFSIYHLDLVDMSEWVDKFFQHHKGYKHFRL